MRGYTAHLQLLYPAVGTWELHRLRGKHCPEENAEELG